MSDQPAGTAHAPLARTSAAVLVVLALASLLAVVGGVLGRALIPYELDGVVLSVEERNRAPGTEVWIIDMADGDRWFVDEAAAEAVRPGRVVKAAWSTTVRVGSHSRTIGWSRDIWGPVTWAAATAVIVGATASRGLGAVSRGRRSPPGRRPPS